MAARGVPQVRRRLTVKQAVKPPRPRKRRGKRGPADPLLGSAWQHWCAHILSVGSSWLYAATVISWLLCLRITETLKLEAESFDWSHWTVVVPGSKGHPATEKPISKAAASIFGDWWWHGGVRARRRQMQGGRGEVEFNDVWKWPVSGLLFPTNRKHSVLKRRAKDSRPLLH